MSFLAIHLNNTIAAISNITIMSTFRDSMADSVEQGCGNTMPDLSDQVPFHSGQVENFYLLVLRQVPNLYKVNKILYLIF